MASAREAEALARGAGHPGMQAESVQLVGLVYLDNGEFEQALAAFRRGLELAQSMDKASAIGQAYNNIGIALRRLGKLDEAVEAYNEALKFRRQGDDPNAVAQTLNNLGVTLGYLGDYPAALAAHSESLDIKRRSGKDEELSDSLYNIAQIYEHLGDLDQALADYGESLRFDERAGQKRNVALGLNKISTVELKLGRLDDAHAHAAQALALFEELGSGRSAANALLTTGRIEIARKHAERAIAPLQRARRIGEDSKDPAVVANANLYLAEARFESGHTAEALDLAQRAQAGFEQIGLKNELRDAWSLLSRLHEAAGAPTAALQAERARAAIERSLLDEQRLRQLGGTRRAIEIQQREREIERLKLRSEQQARDVERATWARNLGLAAGAIVFLLVFLLASRYWHRRQLAEQMRVNRSLQRLDALKDEFLANTSHELRTPLMGILGLAESLLDGGSGPLSDKARHELGLIIASGSRLSTLVDDILDLSKIRRDQLRLDIRPVDLRVVVDVVLALAAPLVGGRGLALRNAVPHDLPAVDADENRLQQILHNLVGNAIKFTERGSVSVGARARGARIEIEVADTGIGIAPDRQQAIFEPFEQGDGTMTRVHGGTGLGLAVTRKLVELHGGHIELTSTPGEGSVFCFDLAASSVPAETGIGLQRRTRTLRALADDANDAADTAQADAEASSAARRRGDRFRVLVVDDEPVNRNVLVNFLSDRYQVREAADGAQALAMLQEEPETPL